MNKMLQNVIQLPGGTAYGMGPTAGNMASAGKTGTTNDWNDLTYVGLTPYYVTSVWWGYDVLHSLYPNTNKPLRILWRDYMNIVQEGLESKEFFYSDNVQQLRFCADTGDLAGPGCTNVRVGYYIPSNIPEQCTAH